MKTIAKNLTHKNEYLEAKNLEAVLDTYQNGGHAIRIFESDGGPWTTATTWVDGLEPDEVAIKNYSENVGMLKMLLDAEIVAPPHRFHNSGWVTIPVCRLLKTEAI